MCVPVLDANSTPIMTHSVVESAPAAVPEGTFLRWTFRNEPQVIQGPQDGAAAVAPMKDHVGRVWLNLVCIVIACIDNIGPEAANRFWACPVIGM